MNINVLPVYEHKCPSSWKKDNTFSTQCKTTFILKGLRFSRHGNTIEVPVSPWIDGNYQETEAVATKLLSKAKDGHETTLAISMASFCNWPFDEYMKCFVKSSVSWLLGQSHVWPSCVILFTESMDHFKKMDEYIEQCVTDWQKGYFRIFFHNIVINIL
jgi:hypothetical protein